MPLTTPIRSPGILVGYLLAGLLLLLIVVLLLLLRAAWGDLLSFFWGVTLVLALAAFLFVSFWTSALGVARYTVAGDTLRLSWGRRQHAIPLAAITAIGRGDGYHLRRWRGVRWPGQEIGTGELVAPDGSALPLTTYATRPLGQQLLVFTAAGVFGLSPADPAFARQLEALAGAARAAGAPAGPVVASLGPLASPLWQDRSALRLLLGGLILNLALFALLAALSGTLPATVPLRFGAGGQVMRSDSALALFTLPLIGLIWWLVDALIGAALYRRDGQRAVALLVWGAGALLQAGAWAALLALVT
jgi:hypothetical protein